MRLLQPVLSDPFDIVIQGEQLRAAALQNPVSYSANSPMLAGSMDSIPRYLSMETTIGDDDIEATGMMLDGMTSFARLFPTVRVNACIATTSGLLIPFYKNECRISGFIGGMAALAVGYTLTAQGGSYTIGGGNATLLKSKNLIASGGSYTLNGASVTILKSKNLIANGGAYSLVGRNVTITYTPASQPNTTLRFEMETGELWEQKLKQITGDVYRIIGTDELVIVVKSKLVQKI